MVTIKNHLRKFVHRNKKYVKPRFSEWLLLGGGEGEGGGGEGGGGGID